MKLPNLFHSIIAIVYLSKILFVLTKFKNSGLRKHEFFCRNQVK